MREGDVCVVCGVGVWCVGCGVLVKAYVDVSMCVGVWYVCGCWCWWVKVG